ncbi:MAG: hydroxyacid dehydrogenase [Candidatus Glassbacteria bacterium]|nr:hydroxyacid dehydrogenase [Candidatus Glassbacteria bacterium]
MEPKILVPVQSIYRDWFLPGHIMERLERLGEVELAVDPGELSRREYAALYRGKDAVLTTWNTPLIDREVLEAAAEVKIISHCGGEVRPFISPELFDIRPDLVLCNVSRVMSKPVAEYILCVTLALMRSLFEYREWVKQDGNWWEYQPDWNVSLLRKKVGIVGLGQVAREFVRLLEPFDVELVISSGYLSDDEAAAQGFHQVTVEEIFATCDVISINAAATPGNRRMIGRDLLSRIKPGAVLVNSARGMLVDEEALIEQLRTGRFKAAVDVTFPEPPAPASPLRDMPNLLLTPHIAGPTPDQRIWMIEEALDNLEAFFSGGEVRGLIDRERFSYMA